MTAAGGSAVIALALGALARTTPGRATLADLAARARFDLLGASVAVMSVTFWLMALRWRVLMPAGHRPPSGGLAAIVCAGLLLNMAVPGPMGEIGAAWFAERRYRVPMADGLASGIAARVVGLASAALMATLFWTVNDLEVPTEYDGLVGITAVTIGAGGALLAGLAVRPLWWSGLSARTLGRIPGGGFTGRLAARAHGAVTGIAEALAAVARRGTRAYAGAAFFSVLGHSCVIAGITLAAWSVGARPEAGDIAFIYAVTTAGAIVLFAFPGGQIGWDAMFFTLLVATAGLGPADALAVAITVRLQQIIIFLVGAVAVGWFLRGTGRE